MNINVSTGDITLGKVIVNGNINIESSTGDVKFVSSDASEIFIKTSTGSVTGTLLTNKNFDCHTSTGDVNIPKIQSGGNCKITTSTGDIIITIKLRLQQQQTQGIHSQVGASLAEHWIVQQLIQLRLLYPQAIQLLLPISRIIHIVLAKL